MANLRERRSSWLLMLLLAGALSFPCPADTLEIDIDGVAPEVADNIRAHLGGGWVTAGVLSSQRRRDAFRARAETEAAVALRPFGYYEATTAGRLVRVGTDRWKLELRVDPGEPVRIRSLELELSGDGADYPEFVAWKEAFPLRRGERLDQPTWEQQKEDLLELADENGFLLAQLTKHRIGLDLDANSADLSLALDTGPRAVFGEIRYEQEFLGPHVLTPVARFRDGDPYRSWHVDQLQTDLWKLGSFDDIVVGEERDLTAVPPVVHLVVRLTPARSITHQGTLGYGTDTDFRMQYRWKKHLLSSRGDSLSAGLGYQTRNDELLLFSEYRLPRRVENHEYWLITPLLRREAQTIALDVDGREEKLAIGDGHINDALIRMGRVRLFNPTESREQVVRTIFVQYLGESPDFELRPDAPQDPNIGDRLLPNEDTQSIAFGVEWDWPEITGQGFDLVGHRERAWIFTSNEAWGSDQDYTQAYLSSRWILRLADRWRLLLRGEVGYSDAKVEELGFEVDGVDVSVSVTELPFQYRFRAGGSFSVRGYSFESLSNNGIGSNNILTTSAEVEYRLTEQWSVVTFADAGNAFNDWDDVNLRKGWGVGVRWHTIAFPIRLDLAQALDIEGEPWKIHVTIGSPLF